MTGELSKEVFDAVLNVLHVEISFVDENDTVRYFNKNSDIIFPRSLSVIGRKVRGCRPKKSPHKVDLILDDFMNNKRSSAEFWADLKGRKIFIRYFAVRDKSGKYLGRPEMNHAITEIQEIKGEKNVLVA